MSVLNENTIIGASGAGGDYEIEQSLRFDEGRETRLIRTPTTNGSATTWTWSAWVKRSELSNAAQSTLFAAGVYNGSSTHLHFAGDNTLHFYQYDGGYKFREESTQVFRDTSAWYHIVAVVDTTNGTAADRIKLYVNGVQITSFANVLNPNQNQATFMNLTANKHYIGDFDRSGDGDEFGGYLAEVNFIDGQALTPDNFGETGDYGEWKPTKYAGTYGTNGFYLPFEQDYTVEGFSTVVYGGNSSTNHYVGGTGFSPDVVWIKARSSAYNHQFYDSVRGATKVLETDSTNVDETRTDGLLSFDTDGFSLGSQIRSNYAGQTYVAWNWDMGGTTASNTNGSITSSVRANTTYGQSIVSYTGNGTAGATVGHGLASAPTMVIVKSRTVAGKHWATYHVDLGNTVRIDLESTGAKITGTGAWNSTTPTSSLVTLGSQSDVNTSSATHIMYAFHDVTGYSKFGSYSGNGSTTGPVVTLGFSPAFLLVKCSTAVEPWNIIDNTRNPTNPKPSVLQPNSSGAEVDTASGTGVDFTSTGFQIKTNIGNYNTSGQTYIYMAFADTREYAYWYDQSGKSNNWTPNNLAATDQMVDSPTNNFSTMNPLVTGGGVLTLAEGNLAVSGFGSARQRHSTMMPSSGKWYAEFLCTAAMNDVQIGIANDLGTSYLGNTANSWGMISSNGNRINAGSQSSYGSAYSTGDIIGVALDLDNGKVFIAENNTYNASGNPVNGSNPMYSSLSGAIGFAVGSNGTNGNVIANFGQDSSFAGNKTPQGNQDANDIGDFYYAPPAGFLALCTQNLPDPTVIPSEHFNTVLYTGTGSSNAVTGVGFAPNFTWAKSRSNADGNGLVDSVRGATKLLSSNTSDAEADSANYFASLDSDGFTVGTSTFANRSGASYVAWNWKLGGSAVSNSNGSVTSQVSANVDAGISIATFTLPTTAQTIGHGLSKAPELVIHKGRVSGSAWWTFHKDIGNTSAVRLDGTNTAGASTNFWNNTSPTSTVVTIGANSGGNNSWMMYCFHSVDGYSRVGSYIGNGNHDGPFVYCGFKPAMVIFKNTTVADDWQIQDTTRSPFNGVNSRLMPNSSAAENTNSTWTSVDYLSNGFKQRYSDNIMNASGKTYIFIAFAENPFKHTNAR